MTLVHEPMRVLLTPHDVAGQLGILARSLRRCGIDAWSVEMEHRRGHLQFELDEHLGIAPTSSTLKRVSRRLRFAVRANRDFDVIHYLFGRTIVPHGLDAVMARRLGRGVVVHFRGSDITTIERRIARSAVLGGDGPRSSSQQEELIDRWRSTAHALLISTPDLWREVPEATLVPQAIELDRWTYRDPRPVAGELIVGHAPTNRAVKGTAHVLAAVEVLRRRGHRVRLELIEGVAPDQVARLMQSCHVGVDQVVLGAYGNVTIQFMALGVPTLNFLDPIFDERGIDVPTVRTAPTALADDLERLGGDLALRRRLARAGRQFVEHRHDGQVVAGQLRRVYESAVG